MHPGLASIKSSAKITATGSSEIKFLAHQTAWPSPRGLCCLIKETEPGFKTVF